MSCLLGTTSQRWGRGRGFSGLAGWGEWPHPPGRASLSYGPEWAQPPLAPGERAPPSHYRLKVIVSIPLPPLRTAFKPTVPFTQGQGKRM